MALIGKIRKNSWLLVVLIALGLGGFIVMDMTSGQQSIFAGNMSTMGEIEGNKLNWNDFNRTESILYNNSTTDVFSRRDALWNYFVEKAIIEKEAEALGLAVTKEELIDLQFGPNPSPIITQRFTNPNTGQVDRNQLNQIRTAIQNNQFTDPTMRSYWKVQENEIIKDRLQTKLMTIVQKGMYTPTWMAQMKYEEQAATMDMAYVKVPYDEIDNTEVVLSDADFKNFIQQNRKRFEKEEETRRLGYVVFDVEPTGADSTLWRSSIEELIPEFESTDEDTAFIERNYGELNGQYLKRDQISPFISDTVFNMEIGSVYGPYMESNAYRAVKVIDRKVIPDSVRARHILRPVQTQEDLIAAQQLVDSLKNLLEAGTHSWDTLAANYGTDGTRFKGGDLGFAGPNQMVQPFNDLIFFYADQDTLYTILTQFGLHLVEVTDKKFINNEEGVRLALLSQSIIPSDETQKAVYDEVLQFVRDNRTQESLEQSISERPELSLEKSRPLSINDYSVGNLGAGQSSRDMILWAFNEAKIGEVSAQIYEYQNRQEYYDDKYVVATLDNIIPKGLPKVDDVKEDIEPLVINKKKGEMLKESMAGKSVEQVAEEFDQLLDTVRSVQFSSSFVPQLGNEPKVLGEAYQLQTDQMTGPIVGNSGVFVVKLLRKSLPSSASNLPELRRNMAAQDRSQVRNNLMQAMKEEADIKDNRSRFY